MLCQGHRNAAGTGAHVGGPALPWVGFQPGQGRLDQKLGFRARDQHRRGDDKFETVELGPDTNVRQRLALQEAIEQRIEKLNLLDAQGRF